MFSTTTCPTCHAVLPQFDKLGGYLKRIGIRVSRFILDSAPEYARVYNIVTVPKFIFFAPGQQPQTYQGSMNLQSMMSFVIRHQVGSRQITSLLTHASIQRMFNESNSSPLLLLLSEKEKVPPMFKQVCFKNRNRLRCAFSSKTSVLLPEILDRLSSNGTVRPSQLTYPSLFLVWPGNSAPIKKFDGEQLYSAVNEFVDDSFNPQNTLQSDQISPSEGLSENVGLAELIKQKRNEQSGKNSNHTEL